MKLFSCNATSIDYDPFGLIVANNEREAAEKFKKQLDDEDTWHTGTVYTFEVNEIDGYEVVIEDNKVKLIGG